MSNMGDLVFVNYGHFNIAILTSNIKWGCHKVFVKYGPYTLRVRDLQRRESWDLSPRFVIYGECPNIDKSHPFMTNPNPPQWVEEITRNIFDQ